MRGATILKPLASHIVHCQLDQRVKRRPDPDLSALFIAHRGLLTTRIITAPFGFTGVKSHIHGRRISLIRMRATQRFHRETYLSERVTPFPVSGAPICCASIRDS